jgi:hypothetical protein
VINGGFQNYLHMMYGLPNGFIQAKVQPDTSDLLLRGLRKKRRKTEEELLEEQIAAQLLQARQKDIVIPETISAQSLSSILESKLNARPLPGEVEGKEREKRIKVLMLALMMED